MLSRVVPILECYIDLVVASLILYGYDDLFAAFSTARGHPIERQNYIDDLMTRKQ